MFLDNSKWVTTVANSLSGRMTRRSAYALMGEAQDRQREHLVTMIGAIIEAAIAVGLIVWLWPGGFPIDLGSLWWKDATFAEMFSSSWPVLAWGVVASLLAAMLSKKTVDHRIFAGNIYRSNLAVSVQAGVFEEVLYRFLYPVLYMAFLPVFNWVMFGWNGGGLVKWFYSDWLIPIANWATFYKLSDYLVTIPWFIGAAIISANASFRDGHKYQGIIGLTNSWFIGMYMFFLMFNYGLVVAIVVHALYDIIIFTTDYFDTLWDNRRF